MGMFSMKAAKRVRLVNQYMEQICLIDSFDDALDLIGTIKDPKVRSDVLISLKELGALRLHVSQVRNDPKANVLQVLQHAKLTTLYLPTQKKKAAPSNFVIDSWLPASSAKDIKSEMADYWDEWIAEYGYERALFLWKKRVKGLIFNHWYGVVRDKCNDILGMAAKFTGLG